MGQGAGLLQGPAWIQCWAEQFPTPAPTPHPDSEPSQTDQGTQTNSVSRLSKGEMAAK